MRPAWSRTERGKYGVERGAAGITASRLDIPLTNEPFHAFIHAKGWWNMNLGRTLIQCFHIFFFLFLQFFITSLLHLLLCNEWYAGHGKFSVKRWILNQKDTLWSWQCHENRATNNSHFFSITNVLLLSAPATMSHLIRWKNKTITTSKYTLPSSRVFCIRFGELLLLEGEYNCTSAFGVAVTAVQAATLLPPAATVRLSTPSLLFTLRASKLLRCLRVALFTRASVSIVVAFFSSSLQAKVVWFFAASELQCCPK